MVGPVFLEIRRDFVVEKDLDHVHVQVNGVIRFLVNQIQLLDQFRTKIHSGTLSVSGLIEEHVGVIQNQIIPLPFEHGVVFFPFGARRLSPS